MTTTKKERVLSALQSGRTLSSGSRNVYRLGTASRALIAAGYRSMANS